jgi:uncharacterized protein YxjI
MSYRSINLKNYMEAVEEKVSEQIGVEEHVNVISAPTSLSASFQHQKYLVRKKILKLAGKDFHIFDPDGQVVFFSRMKAFKLKEDIRIYNDESMQSELITIQARRMLDISAAYDVVDAVTGEKVGVLKRKGMKSILQDEWVIMDANDNEIGSIKEDSLLLALIRRFIMSLIPQNFSGEINGRQVCLFKQNFNPFVSKIELDFSPDSSGLLDRRLGIAAAILLCAIEGKQD